MACHINSVCCKADKWASFRRVFSFSTEYCQCLRYILYNGGFLVVFVVSQWGSRIHFSIEVTWFCQDQVLLQIFQMRQEKKIAHGNSTINKISLKAWLCLLSSLADIFNKLKELSTQWRPVMLISFTTSYKTLAIKTKLKVWIQYGK